MYSYVAIIFAELVSWRWKKLFEIVYFKCIIIKNSLNSDS